MEPVKCPKCSMMLYNDGSFAGQEVSCGRCGTKVRMPGKTTLPAKRSRMIWIVAAVLATGAVAIWWALTS
jgi:hypothetical protein